jgi:hypothetical protein
MEIVDTEECPLLEYGAVWVYYKPTFRRNISPPSSGYRNKASEEKW